MAGRPAVSFEVLVQKARTGDEVAWRELVQRLTNAAWHAVVGFRMDDADAKDAVAATFLRLAEHLDRIREPAKLPGWIITTARREAYAILRSQRRLDRSIDVPEVAVHVDHGRDVDSDELRAAMWAGLQRLSERCRHLLSLLTADPAPKYEEIEDELGMPHGSIGPTRRRCLDALMQQPEVQPYVERHR